jgi:hypothetical protein
MTANAQRWKRIGKVRAVQRHMAEVQLHRCEKELRNLVDLGHRISAIRAAAQPLVGAQNGLMLRSVCELSSRLDSAQRALATPSQNAQEARNRQQHAVVAARQRETAIEKLAANVAAQDAKMAMDRQNRTAIFRKTTKSKGKP